MGGHKEAPRPDPLLHRTQHPAHPSFRKSVARLLDGIDEHLVGDLLAAGHGRRAGLEVHVGGLDARDALQSLLHVAHTVHAHHALYVELLLHGLLPFHAGPLRRDLYA